MAVFWRRLHFIEISLYRLSQVSTANTFWEFKLHPKRSSQTQVFEKLYWTKRMMSRLGCPRTFGISKQGYLVTPMDPVPSEPGYQMVLLLEPVLDLMEGDEVTPGNSCLPKYGESGEVTYPTGHGKLGTSTHKWRLVGDMLVLPGG